MIPRDPVMLLSFVNTQLRDNYSDIDDFCAAYNLSKDDIMTKLGTINYEYNTDTNQFI